MTPIEQAIEALELAIETSYSESTNVTFKAAIYALRGVEQQPVACHKRANDYCKCSRNAMLCDGTGPAAPTTEATSSSDAERLDAARWNAVRKHWKNAQFTYRKDAANLLKTITLLIDFDHNTGRGAALIERDFDAAILATKGGKL